MPVDTYLPNIDLIVNVFGRLGKYIQFLIDFDNANFHYQFEIKPFFFEVHALNLFGNLFHLVWYILYYQNNLLKFYENQSHKRKKGKQKKT